jgi:hypothetical protein
MPECNFKINFTGTPEEVFQKAKSAIEKQKGSFTGDAGAGDFDVSFFGNAITGSYAVNGQELEVTIHSKPFFVPCSAIESMLAKELK